jgi:hypothetical protein
MVYPAYTCGTNRLNAAYPTNSFILRAVRVKTGYTAQSTGEKAVYRLLRRVVVKTGKTVYIV